MTKKYFVALWIAASLLLFLYSFTQVDLSLTFSKASIFQTAMKGFQYVGWFNRPLSTFLYAGIFTILFLLFFKTLALVTRNEIPQRKIWVAIISVTGILALSYNAFSYDLFNYIFDAKIVSYYHLNPYVHKALDFPGDPMLSFMHWTHRTYPYGPLWLVMTVPLTFISNHIFIISFYLFKLLMAGAFLLTVWSIGKIGTTLKFKNVFLPMAAFAFNPFVLSESLVSAHNDIVMMGFAMYGTYFLLRMQVVKGTVMYALSVAVKFATAILIISFFILMGLKKTSYFIGISIILMIGAVILATMRTNFQPWYLLYVLPFAALMIEKRFIRYPYYIFSIAGVIYYIPYLHTGNWDPPIPDTLNGLMILAVMVSLVLAAIFFPTRKKEIN